MISFRIDFISIICKYCIHIWTYIIAIIFPLANLEKDYLTPIREFWTKNPNSGIWASVISGQKIQTIFLIYPQNFQKNIFLGIE